MHFCTVIVIPLCKLENDSIFSSQAIVSRGDKMESFSFIEVKENNIVYSSLCFKICTL